MEGLGPQLQSIPLRGRPRATFQTHVLCAPRMCPGVRTAIVAYISMARRSDFKTHCGPHLDTPRKMR